MTRARIALLAGALTLAAAVIAPAALGCPKGYSYAGLYSDSKASGIAATITMLDEPAALRGTSHVAGWVGVGGPGLGPNGEDEWLQVGLATFGDSSEGRLYYELARPGEAPRYVELASGIRPGRKLRVAVLELPFARDSWIVVSPAGIAGPFYLPRSHQAWEPIATAERYAESTRCNRYAYRFGRLQLAQPDGSWRAMRRASTLQDPGWRLRRHGASAFSATAA
ncbi:MAG: hypothetical protein ACJ75Q_10205 [Gaiellaceae bacterium]